MRTVYVDSDFKCHTTNDGTMLAVEARFFDGKCPAFIEGYRFVPSGSTWVREDGKVFIGEMISPWKNYDELCTAQSIYESQIISNLKETVAKNEAIIAELDAALLDMAY